MSAAGEVLDAAGPEQIRAAFTTAITTADEHGAELAGIAGVLGDAVERYENLQMTASTLGHLRDGAGAITAAAAAVDTAHQHLQTALADFNDRDGQVADAVAETGNLMQADGYTTTFALTGSQEQKQPMTRQPTAPATPRGTYNPGQPRAADGKWIKVGDTLGYADGQTCFGTDRVNGAGDVSTDLALIEYPPDPGNQAGAFVSVATPKGHYNPVTGKEAPRDEPEAWGYGYCAPHLGPRRGRDCGRAAGGAGSDGRVGVPAPRADQATLVPASASSCCCRRTGPAAATVFRSAKRRTFRSPPGTC